MKLKVKLDFSREGLEAWCPLCKEWRPAVQLLDGGRTRIRLAKHKEKGSTLQCEGSKISVWVADTIPCNPDGTTKK